MSTDAPRPTTDAPKPGAPRPRVLYVDDQEGNLVVFKASLKKFADITTASSGAEALGLLERGEYPIIISDQKMPGMTGSEFLAEVRRRWPDTVRMLLTAYSDFDAVVAAINDGQVSRFLSKPWERQDLIGAIASADEIYRKTRENRALTEQLLHRERLAAIGQVISGLVHELGNIAAVLTVADDIRDEWKLGHDLTREMEILKTGVDKFHVLVESLRIYSKGGGTLSLTRAPTDLFKVIESSLVLLKLFPVVKGLRSLTCQPPAAPVVVLADARMLEQVVLNLVKNAAEACDQGRGVVTIRVVPGDRAVAIEIVDNGPGIPPEAWKKIGEGFYSTKGNKGTGLGLSMCRKIVEAHGGRLEHANNPAGGSTFSIVLPRG